MDKSKKIEKAVEVRRAYEHLIDALQRFDETIHDISDNEIDEMVCDVEERLENVEEWAYFNLDVTYPEVFEAMHPDEERREGMYED